MMVPVDSAINWDAWQEGDDYGEDWKTSNTKEMFDNKQFRLESDLIASVQFYDKLGEGANGVVHRVSVILPAAGRRVPMALKIIRPKAATKQFIEMSLNDMKILRYLKHENICIMNEIIGIPDRKTNFPYSVICLFMELCDGNLTKLIGGDKLENNLTRHWFAQAVRGLVYLHSNSIIHGDIQSDNILYKVSQKSTSRLGFVRYKQDFLYSVFKLSDFGLSSDIHLDFEGKSPINIEHGIRNDVEMLFNTLLCFAGKPLVFKCLSQPTASLLDMIDQIKSGVASLEDIQLHQWFQENDEPLTEPFILRTTQPDIHYKVNRAQYEYWDEIANSGPTPEDYAPFGRDYGPEKEFDSVQQQWVRQELPIQGVPHYYELIDRNRQLSPYETKQPTGQSVKRRLEQEIPLRWEWPQYRQRFEFPSYVTTSDRHPLYSPLNAQRFYSVRNEPTPRYPEPMDTDRPSSPPKSRKKRREE